jgi:lysophospholipase
MKLISIPANPVPEDVVTGTLKTPDRVDLRFARWAPPPGRKGTVCIFHGRAEFIEKYYETARELRSRGFAVATVDWRGQGLSQRALRDPKKGYVESFREYETDLEAFMREIVLPDCPPPYYAIGHSMGASILIRIADRGYRWFDRMVLCARSLHLASVRRPTPGPRPRFR